MLDERWKDARIDELEFALSSLIKACDEGKRVERGAGGMTIEAQISRTFINGVPAMAVEKAIEALYNVPYRLGPLSRG